MFKLCYICIIHGHFSPYPFSPYNEKTTNLIQHTSRQPNESMTSLTSNQSIFERTHYAVSPTKPTLNASNCCDAIRKRKTHGRTSVISKQKDVDCREKCEFSRKLWPRIKYSWRSLARGVRRA